MDFMDNLKAKLGPLPVWGWGVLIGGAFIAWYWYSNGSGLGGFSGEGGEEEGEVGQVLAPSGDFSTVPIMPEEEAVTDENTNAEWLIQAVMAAPAGTSKLAAQAALEKYLNGTTMSYQEQQMVDAIIAKVGLPPQGTAGPPDLSPAPSEPGSSTKDWSTKTSISAYKGTWFGNPLVVTATVDWVNGKGHTFKPRGFVEIALDGAMAKRYRLMNGKAVRTVMVSRNVAQFKDKVIVITAKFLPNTGTSEKSSVASPWTTRIQNKN